MIILFSGPISVGKSTVSDLLVSEHGFKRIRTSDYLRSQIALADKQPNRTELQNCGDELDIKTNYMWVIDDVLIPAMSQFPDQENWLFDSVRKPEQVTNFKSKFGLKEVAEVTINYSVPDIHNYTIKVERIVGNTNPVIIYER